MSSRPNPWLFGNGFSRRATQAAASQPLEAPRPELKVLIGGGETPRQVRLGRARLVGSVAVVGLVLFAVVMFHVMLTQGQFKLEKMEARANQEQVQFEKSRLEVAQLDSPSRIIEVATERLGMVPATEVKAVAPNSSDTSPLVGESKSVGDAPIDEPRAQSWSEIKPHLSSSSR